MVVYLVKHNSNTNQIQLNYGLAFIKIQMVISSSIEDYLIP